MLDFLSQPRFHGLVSPRHRRTCGREDGPPAFPPADAQGAIYFPNSIAITWPFLRRAINPSSGGRACSVRTRSPW
jgi:hypothetical protein